MDVCEVSLLRRYGNYLTRKQCVNIQYFELSFFIKGCFLEQNATTFKEQHCCGL